MWCEAGTADCSENIRIDGIYGNSNSCYGILMEFYGIFGSSKVFLRSIESTSFSNIFFLRAHWGGRPELINRSTTSSWEMPQNAQSHTVTSIYLHMVYIKMHIKMYIRNPRVQIFKDSEIIWIMFLVRSKVPGKSLNL